MRKVLAWLLAAATLVVVAFAAAAWFTMAENAAEPPLTMEPAPAGAPPATEPPVPVDAGQPPAKPRPPLARGPIPFPPPPPPAVDFEAVDRALQALPLGSVAFNVPDAMRVNDTADVHLLLSPSASVEDVEAELKRRLRDDVDVDVAEVRIAPRMEARLTGTNFEILSVTPEVQTVTWSEPTEWRWDVSPRSPGRHTLHLTLTAIVRIGDAESTRSLRTLDRDIDVDVTWPQRIESFIGANWQWMWATLVVPAAVWLWKKRGRASTARSRRVAP